MSNLRSRLASINKKSSSIKKATIKKKQMKIASEKNSEDFKNKVIDELNKHGIPVPDMQEHMKEYDITEEEMGNGDSFLTAYVMDLFEGAKQQGAKFDDKKIKEVQNNAGNVAIITEDDEEYDIYSGFEYDAYFQDKKWLDEGLKNIKKIQW